MDLSRTTILVLACALAVVSAKLHPLSDDFIDLINSKQTTWKAGRNFPHNTPLKHIKRLLGVLPDFKRDSSIPSVKHDADLIASLPDNFDARKKWPNCPSLSEIRDQGSCGSCWAFSAVEAMTDRVCIYSGGKKQFHFSAEDLLSCCKDCGWGCDGGSVDDAWKYWQEHGIVSGGNYNSGQDCKSYSIPSCVHHAPGKKINATKDIMSCFDNYVDTPKCSKICNGSYGVAYEKDKLYGKKVYSIDSGEDHMMAELFLNGPVEASMIVYLDFFNYKSGIYVPVDEDNFIGGHAVKIIGWGVENETKYWLVANSWNAGWGDKGFFKIRRGYDDCFIESLMIMAGKPLLTEG